MTSDDRWAIQNVMQRYAVGVDERDRKQYRDCFADDVEIVGFSAGVVKGADAWTQTVWEILERFESTQHMLGPVFSEIAGDRATARTDVQATHFMKEPAGSIMILWATYLTEMARINGEWKMTRHELVSRGRRTFDAP